MQHYRRNVKDETNVSAIHWDLDAYIPSIASESPERLTPVSKSLRCFCTYPVCSLFSRRFFILPHFCSCTVVWVLKYITPDLVGMLKCVYLVRNCKAQRSIVRVALIQKHDKAQWQYSFFCTMLSAFIQEIHKAYHLSTLEPTSPASEIVAVGIKTTLHLCTDWNSKCAAKSKKGM